MTWSSPAIAVLGALGAIHGFFLSTALTVSKRGDRSANRVLALFVGLFSLQILNSLIYHSGLILTWPHLAAVQTPSAFAFGPLLYLFVRLRLGAPVYSWSREIWHFLPVFAFYAYLGRFYAQDAQAKILFLEQAIQQPPPLWWARTAVAILQIAVYLCLSIQVLRATRDNQGGARRICGLLILAVAVFWIFGVLRYLFAYHIQTNLIIPASLSIVIYWLGFFMLVMTDAKRPAKTPLKPDRREPAQQAALTQLNRAMDEEQLFLDPHLQLTKLAQAMNWTPAFLSQLLNAAADKNFNDYVNAYRVGKARELLASPDYLGMSIAGIGEEAGFRSRSTFYAAFKKHTGKLPRDFRCRAGADAEKCPES